MQGLISQYGDDGNGALFQRALHLVVDEIVGKVDVAGILAGVTVIDAADASPVDGPTWCIRQEPRWLV